MGDSLTREQIRAVDRLAVEKYRMPSLLLMEDAGRNAAKRIRRRFGDGGRAVIVCGTGNNGGDGCVIARHLHNCGWSVRLIVTGEAARMSADMKANFDVVEAMGLPIAFVTDRTSQHEAAGAISGDEIVVDALLGTGFRGDVRSPLAELIDDLNAASKRAMVAVDVPSGLDCDSGEPSNATIRADVTITFVARKIGFDRSSAASFVGEVEVADIGAPIEAIEEARRVGA